MIRRRWWPARFVDVDRTGRLSSGPPLIIDQTAEQFVWDAVTYLRDICDHRVSYPLRGCLVQSAERPGCARCRFRPVRRWRPKSHQTSLALPRLERSSVSSKSPASGCHRFLVGLPWRCLPTAADNALRRETCVLPPAPPEPVCRPYRSDSRIARHQSSPT